MPDWDRFFSEDDRALFAALTPSPKVGFGDHAALLLVDEWQAMLGERPLPVVEAVSHWPLSFGERAWDAVDQTRTLLAAARAHGIPVIHTTIKTGRFAPNEWFSGTRTPSAAWKETAWSVTPSQDTDPRFDLIPVLRPIEGEILIEKTGPSGFWGTPLAGVLQQYRVDTLLVVGESTSGCVHATVVDAASHRFKTIVVQECVYDRYEASHALALFNMDQKYADVLGVSEVLDWLEERYPVTAGAATLAPHA